jgi:predicted dehydrogenase
MEPRIRVAVVGGGIGRQHAEAYRALNDRFDLRAICDLDAARAQEIAHTFEIPRTFASLNELCAQPDIDVIDLCTPPFLHFAQIEQVLAAGKHAICEKPLVGSLREVDALAAAEARSGKCIMPIFQYRFGHGLQKLKYLNERGLAGTPYLATVDVSWRRRAAYYAVPWRGKWQTELGGAVISHAIHALDMLTYVLGPAKTVFARTSTRVNPIEVEDCAAITLELASGALATVGITLGSAAEITRHRFSFSQLVAESNTEPYANSHEPWSFTPDTPELAGPLADALAQFTPRPEGFAGQLIRFYEALQSGGALPVTLADARVSIELITAIYASAAGGAPVTLPLAPDHPAYGGWAQNG